MFAAFINSTVRLIIYPFSTYIIFSTTHKLDPWCLLSECTIELHGQALSAFLIQIFTSIGAYTIAWIASAMTLRRPILLALFCSTPFSLAVYYLHAFAVKDSEPFFFLNISEHNVADLIADHFSPGYIILIVSLVCGIFSQLIVLVLVLWHCCSNSSNLKVLPSDEDMFHTPLYDGVFLDQHLLLNMKREYNKGYGEERDQFKVYICSTMYRESEHEMKQLILSLKNFSAELLEDDARKYESFIIFDQGVKANKLGKFPKTLLNIISQELGLQIHDALLFETGYGWCINWKNGLHFSISILLKDPNKVKNKKRWSQVLYMKFILEHCLNLQESPILENSYILTTDADITFDKSAVDSLLDRMTSNPQIGGVCSRTRPKGSGLWYWYQVFDYAIGHWLQKSTEDIMGCVLCCPGCFSMFRCSAIKKVLPEYSKPATNGNEFLMRNMGEDRWLCTLLIKEGYLLVYCALSSIYTYCPETFEQFYSQRRRWIPSTIANIASLIIQSTAITKNNGHVSILFILYQAVIVFSTAIAPATVIFVISTGIQSSYGISDTFNLIIVLGHILLGISYGLICIFNSPKTQIDVAKIFSAIFGILMILVIVGLVKEVVHSIFPGPNSQFLRTPNCSVFVNDTSRYSECELVAKYLNSLPNAYEVNRVVLPVSFNILYLALFAFIFVITALLHWREWTDILHSLTYFLALPTGYLLLPIYSAANLNIQSWGTREEKSKEDEGLFGLVKKSWGYLVKQCLRIKHQEKQDNPPEQSNHRNPPDEENHQDEEQGGENEGEYSRCM